MRLTGAVLLVAALAACRQPAPAGFTLLFFRSSSTAQVGSLSWAPDLPGGRLVAFDEQLHVTRVVTAGIDQPVAVAVPCGHVPIVSDYSGQVTSFDTAWKTPSEFETHFPASIFASAGCRWIEGRSPYLIEPFSTDTTKGLVVTHDVLEDGGLSQVGALHPAALPFLVGPENAGALALDSTGAFYFAPVARDEITKYNRLGVSRWTARRGLYPQETEPRFLPNRGKEVPLQMARAGIALTLGPDGRLYALGADDSTASKLRVDVLDTATGTILLTRHLGPKETAVALDPHGDLVTFDADSLTSTEQTTPDSRLPFSPLFKLPDLGGDTVRLKQDSGKVTLVNFWASWCDPCREEFPHMASLYGKFSRKDFEIAAISDDVDPARMRAFVAAFHPPFPILVGGGRMKALYHYRGLPYSVLLDRHGRIVKRIFGFGGPQEFQELAATIAKEI
ncbi:MAG TPA: TlpA disulfide reductase family protein, partial [Gemmatimonadales bacterium]|nr:TlpA disulfide reductase family protein [Gemmatimonadales bacterium]